MINQVYVGTVQGVYPPGNPLNRNGYQHEYAVLALCDNFTQIPLQNVLRADTYGAVDEYSDAVLEVSQKVLVVACKDMSQVFIVGAVRNSGVSTAGLGHFFRHRYNHVTTLIDDAENWSVTSDAGPNVQINRDSIVIDDGAGDNITLDVTNKILTVNANSLTIVVNGDASVEVSGDLSARVGGDASVDVSGTAALTGDTITLNGSTGNILTTETWPVDPVSGIPTVGTPVVQAGTS
jgi:hypothetical protein